MCSIFKIILLKNKKQRHTFLLGNTVNHCQSCQNGLFFKLWNQKKMNFLTSILKTCQLLNNAFEILHLIGKNAFVFSPCCVIFSRSHAQFVKNLDLKQKIYFERPYLVDIEPRVLFHLIYPKLKGGFLQLFLTHQLPMGAGHCPWGGFTDWNVCNIDGEVRLASRCC